MEWQTITTIIGALGGLELLKWLWTRKAARRKADLSADRDQWELLREQLLFYQNEVKDKTKHIRELNEELIATKTELALKRCDRKGCANRLPPNGY